LTKPIRGNMKILELQSDSTDLHKQLHPNR